MVGVLKVFPGGRRSWVMVLVCLLVVSLLVVVAAVRWYPSGGADDAALVVALGDGFTVAEGTELAGTVFPGERSGGWNGWVAHLVLTGNPVVVMDRYLSQARAAGFSTAVKCEVGYVTPKPLKDPRDPRTVEVSLDGEGPDGWKPTLLSCDATGELKNPPLPSKPGRSPQSFRLSVRRSMSGYRRSPGFRGLNAATLVVGSGQTPVYGDRYPPPPPVPEGWRRDIPRSWVARAPGRPKVGSAPLPGQRFFGDIQPSKVIRVERGTEVVEWAMEGADCGYVSADRVFVGRVVGDRDTVLDSYFKQIDTKTLGSFRDPRTGRPERWFTPPTVTESTFRGERVTRISAYDGESGDNQVVITAVGDTHPWLRVSICVR